jgi:hypothetical protein
MSNTQMTENTISVEISTDDHVWSSRMLPRGKNGGLICAESGEEIHHSYNPEDTGFLSYKKKMWFTSQFNNHLHSWKNNLAPYDDPSTRVNYTKIFKKYVDS